MMGNGMRNLGFAVRSLRKAPTFALASVLLMGLGVGVVTTVFTVVDHVLLRPLPYAGADRMVYLTNGSHNGPTLERLDGVEAFELWTASSTANVNLSRTDGEPLRLRRTEVTPEFFTLFEGRPHLGRLLTDADRNDLRIAVLTYPFWRDVFGADPEVVGTTMLVDGEPVEIVGVLSEDFVHPHMVLGDAVHFYRPMDWTNPGLQEPGYFAHSVTARLRPGISVEAADEQIARLQADVAEAFPDFYDGGPRDTPLQSLHDRTVEDVRGGLLLLLGAVGLLLLVACANVAHLFMARGLSRSREMSIRRAMGARTWNLLSQLSAESLVVGLLGGATGLLLARGALAFFGRWMTELPRGSQVGLDLRIFLASFGLATLAALVFGLVPAFRTVGRDVQEGLRSAGRGMSGSRKVRALRSGLVVFEVAVSLVLVASAGLLMRSFLAVTSIDPGVDAEDVWVVPLTPANVDTPEEYRIRMDAVLASVRELPAVERATYGMEMPFEFFGGNFCCWGTRYEPEDGADSSFRVNMHAVSSGFFETLGTELVAGSVWDALDAGDEPTPVVVSEPFAVRVFGAADAAVGRELPDLAAGAIVAGVAEATRHYGLDQDHDYAAYLPVEALTFPIPRATFAVRTRSVPADLTRRIQEAVWAEEPNLPVPGIHALDEWVARSSATRRFGSFLFGAFGVVALLLAAAGLYGTLLYTVGQRKQELGIRLALGAGRSRIQNEVIRRGVVHAAVGVGVGGAVALLVGRVLESWLYGVSATDPVALAAAGSALIATAALASWVPAYRAGRTDPLETLNVE